MITDNEKFIEIQAILSLSDISSNDCIKINNLIIELSKENQELKKQLKPNYYVKGLEGTLKEYQQEMNKVAIQQKEFIKYINDCIKELEKESPNKLQNTINLGIIDITKTILQKYKSTIGENDV